MGFRVGGGLALAVGLFCGCANAQEAALQVVEPERFALVIGNAEYRQAGTLTSLGTPCRHDPRAPSDPLDPPGDADLIADAFHAAHWTNVEKVCNLTASELRDKLTEFVDKVQATERAFGIVYFSGHGAQVGERNYLFGVDADIDPALEARKYAQNRNAVLFGKSAVELESALSPLNPLWGKGVVFIVDACRDNPILEDLQKAQIDVISYPTRIGDLDGVVLSFASKKGVRAPDGAKGTATPFAQALATAIRTQAPASGTQIEDIISVVNTKIDMESLGLQQPRKVGELRHPPEFCLRGCPSEIISWRSLNKLFPGGITPRAENTASSRQARNSGPASGGRRQPLLHRITYGAPSLVSAPSPDQAADPASGGPDDARRPISFNIYWCDGDAQAGQRKATASRIKDALDALRRRPSPFEDFRLGSVRALPLPADLGARFKITGDSIQTDPANPGEAAWAGLVEGLSPTPLRIVERRGSGTPDLLPIYVCGGFNPAEPVDLVYLQVARDDQKARARAVALAAKDTVPGVAVWGPKILEGLSPDRTEVRYFYPQQVERAEELASSLGDQLGHAVTLVYKDGFDTKLAGRRAIEIWIGREEDMTSPRR